MWVIIARIIADSAIDLVQREFNLIINLTACFNLDLLRNLVFESAAIVTPVYCQSLGQPTVHFQMQLPIRFQSYSVAHHQILSFVVSGLVQIGSVYCCSWVC